MPQIHLLAPGVALTLALALAPGCDRPADPLLCGDLAAGDLVITEIRGGPNLTDALGQWLEVYNASGGSIDLHGVAISIGEVDDETPARVLVRRSELVAAGTHAVIGKFADDARPDHVDVGWGTAPALPRSGQISLSCGGPIDAVAYTDLPDPSQVEAPQADPPPAGRGTYAFGGTPPTADGNDDTSKWCADATVTLGPCNQGTCLKYFKGSPGVPNPGCTP